MCCQTICPRCCAARTTRHNFRLQSASAFRFQDTSLFLAGSPTPPWSAPRWSLKSKKPRQTIPANPESTLPRQRSPIACARSKPPRASAFHTVRLPHEEFTMATFFNPVIPSKARNLPSPSTTEASMSLADWRRRIDEIDRKLVELLNERPKCALELGKLKQQGNLPLYKPDREKEVLENAEQNNKGPLPDAAIRRLFERIIDEARSAERLAMHSDADGKTNTKAGARDDL